MKRHESLMQLSREHHDGLITAQILKKGAANYKGMPSDFEGKSKYIVNFFYQHLVPHFKDEEEKLFPLIINRKKEIDKLVDELLLEHKEIEDHIKTVEENKHSEETLNKLGSLLDDHIRKEERQLFQIIQDEFNQTELEKIKEVLLK